MANILIALPFVFMMVSLGANMTPETCENLVGVPWVQSIFCVVLKSVVVLNISLCIFNETFYDEAKFEGQVFLRTAWARPNI